MAQMDEAGAFRRVYSLTLGRWCVERDGPMLYQELVTPGDYHLAEYYAWLAGDPLEEMAAALCMDHTTRRAVFSLWPDEGKWPNCATTIQGLWRDGTLDFVVTMRSSAREKWHSDLNAFRCLALMLADKIGHAEPPVGKVRLTVFKASDHYYEDIGGS